MRKPHCLLILLSAKTRATTDQEEFRDILLGASHAINHAPRTKEEDGGAGTKTNFHETWKQADTTMNKRRTKPVAEEDWEEKYGPKIVAHSFGMLANTFGFVADTLRVTGDTASGVLGSSIKLMGTAIKSTGSRFDNAGNWITPEKHQQQQKYSREWLLQDNGTERRHKLRSLAGRSVKLMGTVVQEVGDVLVMTGAATESFGSLTASVAQDSVRALQDIANMAGSLADNDNRKKSNPRVLIRPMSPVANEGPTISYGSYDSPAPAEGASEESTAGTRSSIADAFVALLSFITDETGGVPSQAPELFVVFVLCYIGAILTLGGSRARKSPEMKVVVKTEPRGDNHSSVSDIAVQLVLLPFRIIIFLFQFLRRVVCSRYTLLLFGYSLLWLHVCHMSQIRSKSIHSSAEAQGYKFALSSLQAGNPAMRESMTWLNTQLEELWRIPSPTCPRYPPFVLEGMKCVGKGAPGFYGGLEPFLSWSVGDGLTAVLDNSQLARARSIAYVSLESLSLGSHPPVIRHVETLGECPEGGCTDYHVEVDLALEDLSLVLGIELSSLQYAMLPTTRIAVRSLRTIIKFKARTTTVAHPPFISNVELSLVNLPDLSFRITPLDDESGLQGVDLGSLPLIREWLQGAVREFLSSYVSPKYVSINLEFLYKHPSVASAVSSLPLWKRSSGRRSLAVKGQNQKMQKVQEAPSKGVPFHRSLLVKPKTKAAKLTVDRYLQATDSNEEIAKIKNMAIDEYLQATESKGERTKVNDIVFPDRHVQATQNRASKMRETTR